MKKLKNLSVSRKGRYRQRIKNIAIIGVIIILAVFLFDNYYHQREDRFQSDNNIKKENFAFENLSLQAKAVYVFDLVNNKVIFEKNSSAQLPLASLTKIMTTIVAKENLPEWLKIKISKEAIMQEGDNGFLVGENIYIDNLIASVLVGSSNDAAFALASGGMELDSFILLMNQKAKELKLTQTFFLNPTGLDISEALAGGYGSAKDVAKMLIYAFKKYPELFEKTRYPELSFDGHNFKNTNELAEKIPGLLAGKTGFSDLAGGNLAVIMDIGFYHPVAIVVLGSTREGRFEDVNKIYNALLK